MKRSSTTSVSRFFLETLVVASNDAGLAKATIDLGLSDVGRRYVGLDPSLPIVLSCAGMRWPRRPKLRSPGCAYDEGRHYWDLATLEIQPFRPMRCSRAQAGRLLHHFRARHWRGEWQARSTGAHNKYGAPTTYAGARLKARLMLGGKYGDEIWVIYWCKVEHHPAL